MRKRVWGICGALVLLLAVGWLRGEPPQESYALPERQAAALITHSFPGGTTGDHLVVMDPATRVMAVYRVSRENGAIALLSARKVHWDLQLLDYNTENPLPEEIQAAIERQ